MYTVGIDEVGRGCWAGPLVAGAVILAAEIPGIHDSKILSKRQREKLEPEIKAAAIAVGLGWVWPKEIDKHGITWAVKAAMERALAQITVRFDEIIIDDNINYLPNDTRSTAIIKADATVPAVSAASIAAKVARDKYMAELGGQYARYGFAKHVGYGTAQHIAALQAFGVSDVHRLSFKPVKRIVEQL